MAQTKIKAAQFSGVIGNGTDGYILQSSGNGDMEWVSNIVDPTVTSLSYSGSLTAADPAGGETVTITGTGFKTGANVTIDGTAAPSVSFVSATTLTITTPAKAAGDYDVVVTNTDTGTGTKINGISYNGVPAWTTAAGSLGTFASDTTISTITLQASEPDAGTITFDITNGALPTGLSLTGANIDGTTSIESADTLYNFTVTATDDENQSTGRAFSITIEKYIVPAPENFEIVTYTGNGGTQTITSKIGKAASFNGSSSSIEVSNLDLRNIFDTQGTSGEFSISFWHNSTYNDYGRIIEFSKNFNISYFTLATKKIQFNLVQSNGTSVQFQNSTTFSDNVWYNVSVTYDSANIKVYINGSLDTTQSYDGTIRNFTDSNYQFHTIGSAKSVSSGIFFNYIGKLDQVRIFNKALSSGEVTTLYGETYASSTKSTTDIFGDSSGVALYELDEDANDTGGTYNGTPTNVNFLGMAFQPDLVWIKDRDGTDNHVLQDSIRGVNSVLFSNLTNAVSADTDNITSFNSNGFSIGTSTRINANSEDHVAWCWKAGGTAVSNTDGTITSTVSANQDAGFSVVTFTDDGSYSNRVGTGLTQPVELVIEKKRNGTGNWYVITDTGSGFEIGNLNTTNAFSTNFTYWDGVNAPDNTTYKVGHSNGDQIVSYCFHSVDGYQKIGSYTGDGTSSNLVVTGFQPRFVMFKKSSSTGNWYISDNLRRNGDNVLRPNTSESEFDGGADRVDFESNGFRLKNSDGEQNGLNETYIYLAIA